MSTETELAWAAGLFDGEGHFGRPRTGGYVAIIGQKDREVLDRFTLAVGLGKVYGPYAAGHKSPMFQWQATSYVTVKALFDAIAPYLSRIKIEQGTTLLSHRKETVLLTKEERIRRAKERYDSQRALANARLVELRKRAHILLP